MACSNSVAFGIGLGKQDRLRQQVQLFHLPTRRRPGSPPDNSDDRDHHQHNETGVDAAVSQELGLIRGVLAPSEWLYGAVQRPDQKSANLYNRRGREIQTSHRPAPGREIVGQPPNSESEIAGR